MSGERLGPTPNNFEIYGVKPPAIKVIDIKRTFITDSTGVSISSDRREELAKGIDFEYQACPFHNSPSRVPENQPDPENPKPISGLERRRLAENYPAMMSIAKFVRDGYLTGMKQKEASVFLNANELEEVLHGLFYLPYYLVLRANNPIASKNTLHPAIIALSNSASGSAGALSGYLEKNADNTQAMIHPVPEDMIDVIEHHEKRPLIGEKTVCVASPDQMRHFLSSLIDGINMSKAKFDVSSIIDASEIPSIIQFGRSAYGAQHLLNGLKTIDRIAIEEIKRHKKKKHNPRRTKRVLDDFSKGSYELLSGVAAAEHEINEALGRQQAVRNVSVAEFKSEGFEMPEIFKQAGFESPGAVAYILHQEDLKKAS